MSQQINLLRPKDRSTSAAIAGMAVVGAAVVGLLGYNLLLRTETARLQDEAALGQQRLGHARNLIQELHKSKGAEGDGAALAAEISLLRPRVEGFSQLMADVRKGSLGNPEGFARHYDTLAGVSVEGLWITGILVGKGGTAVTVHGRALRNEAVMQYAARLNQAFGSQGVRFNALELLPEAVASPAGSTSPALHVVAFKLY
jgi:hypothetical protein